MNLSQLMLYLNNSLMWLLTWYGT